MSAETTNIEKQAKRHWGPLVGFIGVAAFVAGLTFYILGADPDDAVANQAGQELAPAASN